MKWEIDRNKNSIEQLRTVLAEADSVVVGAGAGLSTSAGFRYDGDRFNRYLGDFGTKYGFSDMYTGGFAVMQQKPVINWAYWSRNIYINRYMDPPKDPYGSTDFRKLRMSIPPELLPHCPDNREPMTMNLRADDTFVEDPGWHAASRRYTEFLQAHSEGKVLFLDLGSGGNTPVIFKIPFMSWTRDWPSAIYATINKGQAFTVSEIKDKSIVIDDDINAVLEELLKN